MSHGKMSKASQRRKFETRMEVLCVLLLLLLLLHAMFDDDFVELCNKPMADVLQMNIINVYCMA